MVLQKARKIFCSVLSLFIGFSAASLTSGSSSSMKASADFEMNAAQIVEDIDFGWNLGNSLDSYVGTALGCQDLSSETSWGNPKSTQALIDSVKASGINAIRVPITWYNHMDSDYTIDSAWMDRVEEVVGYVLKDDMYCIINVHHDTGENGWLKASSTNYDTKKAMYKAIWEQIAARFNSYGDKLIFEGFNEILDDNSEWVSPNQESLDIVNELNQIFVDTVRASGGNNAKRNLICNTYAASGNSYVTSNFQVPTDIISNRIIAECHVYQPFYFTSEFYPNETTWEKNKNNLDEQLDAIYTNFVQKGTPAIIGEFGCAYTKDNMDEILSWADYYVTKCESYGIPCFYWDNGSQYKLFNRNNGNVTQKDLLGTMLAAATGSTYEIDTAIQGDLNDDKIFSITDVALLQKWLLAVPDTQIANLKAANFCEDERINVFDLCMIKQLLLQKENMCSSEDNWSSWVDSTNGAAAEASYNGNSVSIEVKSGGSNPWEAQISYNSITLEKDATYKLSFDYAATANVSSDCNVMQDHDNYMPYHTVNLDYTTTAQHMESEFTMTSATDKNCKIGFNCGGKNMTPCTITISNLSLIKVTSGSTADETSDTGDDDDNTAETSVNLCANANNWSNWVNEEEGASAEITNLDNGIKVEVQNSGAEAWYVQGSYAGVTLEKGAKYRLEFDYESNQNASLGVNVQQNYAPYGQYYYEGFDYTASEKHFSTDFTMTYDTDDNVVIVFNYGGKDIPSGFIASVTNLSLVKIS